MISYVYIIENAKGEHYIGIAPDLVERLKKHNTQGSRWTKHKGPWQLIYRETCQSKQDALLRERKIKSYKGGEAFKKLLDQNTWKRGRVVECGGLENR